MREPGTIPYGHASPISHGHGEHAKSTYMIKHQRHAQRVAKVGWFFTYLSHLLYLLALQTTNQCTALGLQASRALSAIGFSPR